MNLAVMTVALLPVFLQDAAAPRPDLAVISARLGPCAADFVVTDGEGKPVYAATVHVRVRYGFMSLKRMDLEVGTNSDGKARVDTLPASAKPLVYDITKDGRKTTVEQNLSTTCQGTYPVTLK